jgi:DNA-binding SARP family transcriptional activator
MIQIRTLGSLAISRDGTAFSGAATHPRRMAVLALVARAGSRGITRDRLISLLWPDSDEQASRASLSQVLHALRRQFGDEEVFLGVQTLTLNEAVASCDVVEFETALDDGNWERAVAAYGGPFLDGFRISGLPEMDRWIDEERSQLALRYADAVERLARNAVERGNAHEAVKWWRRRASTDPLNARVTVELMKALDAAGDRAGALQQARIYEALVDQELSLPPDRDVVRFAELLRSGAAPSPDRPVVAAPSPTPPTTRTEPTGDVAAPTGPVAAPASSASGQGPRASRRPLMLAAILLVIVVVAGTLALTSRDDALDSATPVLAVGEIVDRRAGADETFPAAEILTSNMGRVSGIQVLSRIRVLELLSRRPVSEAGRVSIAAREAGATELLQGGVQAIADGRLLLDLQRIDLRNGKLINAYRLEGRDLFDLMDRASSEVAASLGKSPPTTPAPSDSRSLVAYRFYEEGLMRFASGDFRTARGLFDAALREDSLFAMAAFYKFRSAGPMGLLVELSELDRLGALATVASDRERLLIQGTLAMRHGPTLSAIADTFVVRYPQEVDAHWLAGVARLDRGELLEALPYLYRVLALDSAAIGSRAGRCLACDALLQLKYAYHALDSLPRAEALIRNWVQRDSASAVPWITLASILTAAGRFDEANEARNRAAALSPDVDPLFPAVIRIHSGDFNAADQNLRALLRDSPSAFTRFDVTWKLAISLRNQGRWPEVIDLVSKAYQAVPASRRAEFTSAAKMVEAQALFESNALVASARIWDSLARHPDPRLPEGERSRRQALMNAVLADVSYSAGDAAGLARAADSTTAWANRPPHARLQRLVDHVDGLQALARQDTAAAIASFRRAIWSPTLGYTRSNYRLAQLLMAQRRTAEAVPYLNSALRGSIEGQNLYVTYTELHELLARAWIELGRPDSAAAHQHYLQSARGAGR